MGQQSFMRACLEVLAREPRYSIPLTERMVLSPVGESHPLRPSAQFQEGCTWSGEGGREHLPSQLDQPNQPW